jgi:DNA-binding response OmpR family regulator
VQPHLLFVDDEAPIRDLFSLYFRKKGFQVTTVATIQQAMDLLAETQFHVAILDLNLAGEDGLDLFGYIKAKWPTLPVIIFTGLNISQDVLTKALAGRVAAIIQKTEPMGKLYTEVCRHLPSDAAPIEPV